VVREQRKLAAIVAADVVAYSRLIGRDESGTVARLRQNRAERLDPVLAKYGGRLVKLTGDGALVEFASAVDALSAAIEFQQGMSEANQDQPEDTAIVFRIGLHLGDLIVEGDDLYGDGVNIAARLEAEAPTGGIVISRTVHEAVAGRLKATFDDLGSLALKNIERPVQAFRVTWDAADWKVTLQTAADVPLPLPDRPSIAVLPFTNMSGDPQQEYFADGITEDIITDLSRWRRLTVQSRSASFRYRGTATDHGRIAHELSVRYIVEGSVRRLGERIRITAQLIDTETGSHVWAERFDRESADVFKVQDEVVRTIVSTLVGRVQAADAERVRRKPPASLAAYECVLQGNAMPWSDPKGAAEAARLFEKAIEIDPGYGFAHALLAVMRYREWCNDLGGSDAALDESYRLAKRAVELAGNESTCFSILSQACLLRRSFDLALQYMQRAVEINATNQWNTADMGNILCHLGRAMEAIAWFKRARQIDPYFDPPWYWHGLGLTHMVLHRYEEAVTEFERASARPFQVSAYLSGCHTQLGAIDRARLLTSECLEKRPDFTISRWMAKVPFKDSADAAHVAECLRAAGLPE
jgi:adenylate cyclase